MSAHWLYLKYVVRHKWFVYRAGRLLGVSRLQLLIHDWQKFTRAEWGPYVRYFYSDTPDQDAFDRAWLHHQKLGGKHHWQYWVLREDDGSTKALEVPDRYRREMLADWRGAGLALGKPDTAAWYEANREKMVLHDSTREWIEAHLP